MFNSSSIVLVVDDALTMRSQIKIQLRKMGINEILEAANGEDALFLLEAQADAGKPVSLILCDMKMPKLNGMGLLRKLRQTPRFKSLPFLMISAQDEMEFVVEAVQAGVSNYIIKPFSPATLQAKLEEVWKKHFPDASGGSQG